MATASTDGAAPQLPVRQAGTHDRLFYGGMAIALGLTVFAGFASTYYLRFLTGGPKTTFGGKPFTTLFQVHGALFTAWVLLFIVQTALVAGSRVAVHRRLGIVGAVLAAAMIVAGTFAAIVSAARGSAPTGVDPLAFLIVPLFDIFLFARLPGVLRGGPPAFFGLSFLFVVVAGIYDFLSRRRLHRVYLWGGTLIAISVPLRLLISKTGAWRSLAELLTR